MNTNEALAKYQRATELAPDNVDAYYNWGLALADLKRYEEALMKFQRVIELAPNDAKAYYNWGNSLANLKRYEEALEKYQRATELAPDDADAYYNLACLYSLLREKTKSLSNLKIAIRKDSKYAEDAKKDPDFDNVREDPQFKQLTKLRKK